MTGDKRARSERRASRLERRQARIAKANVLYNMSEPASVISADAANDIATLSTLELLQHALHRALREQLYTQDEVESFDPRVLVTLPRLAMLYGVAESNFPLVAFNEQEEDVPQALQTPAEVFLPRLCRSLAVDVVRDIRQMSTANIASMARLLCVSEAVEGTLAEGALLDEDSLPSALSAAIFRAISTEADTSGRAGRQVKLMRKVLKIHLSKTGQDSEAEDEVLIAKGMLATAGLIR